MKVKKFTTILLVLTILLAQFAWVNFSNVSYAATDIPDTEATQYFGKQLKANSENANDETVKAKSKIATKFYDAMVKMYEDGTFEAGTDLDLLENNVVTESDLQAYAIGNEDLLYGMAAAKDAFQYDYPDAFWIDYSALSLRVTRDTLGNYHGYLGRGREDDYFLPGFTKDNVKAARANYENKMSEVLQEINNSKETAIGNSEQEKIVRAVHDWEMNQMKYRFEYEVENFGSSDGYSNARTAYDCLIYGEGVCEAYTRGFKAILDRLEIPCVCVIGGYRVSDKQTESHIWNYVKIGNDWYGVDVTHDDDEDDTKQNHKFFLVGSAELYTRRIPTGIFSGANYEFSYPGLQSRALMDVEENYEEGKFKAQVVTGEMVDSDGSVEENAFIVKVSYDGKNYTQNVEQNKKYILARFASLYPSGWVYTDWGYLTPEYYSYPMEKPKDSDKYYHDEEFGNYLLFEMPHCELVQFAVTDIPFDASNIKDGGMYYQGDPSLLTERTKEFVNNTGNVYKAPPYIAKANPPQYVKLGFEDSYKIRLEYDDYFKKAEDAEEDNGHLEITSAVGKLAGKRVEKDDVRKDAKLTDITYYLGSAAENDNAWVEFTFTPSDLFAGNEVCYDISWLGVVGGRSDKAPMPANYAVGAKCDFCSLQGQGIDANVFAQPELMDASSLSSNGWEAKDMSTGESVNVSEKIGNVDLSQLSHRLTLTTTTVTGGESQEMLDKVSGKAGDIESSQTYNIRMQLCKMQVVNTGDSVRIRLGFPEGTTYEDYISGAKEFKVYHYHYDEYGKLTDEVDEIPVTVTRQGLILYVDSFSPFTIAAVKGSGEAVTDKELVISSTSGGTVTCDVAKNDDEKIDVTNKEEVTITVSPNENKVIESATVGTNVIPVEDMTKLENGAYSFKVKVSELAIGTTNVKVSFMSKIVEEEEEEHHEKPVETPVQDEYEITTGHDGQKYITEFANTAEDLQMSVKALKAKMTTTNTNIEIVDKSGNAVQEDNIIGTGMKVKITKGTATEDTSDDSTVEYTIVVYGDITGDGKMSTSDIRALSRHMIEANGEVLEGAYLEACDYDRTGKVGTQDLKDIKLSLIN